MKHFLLILVMVFGLYFCLPAQAEIEIKDYMSYDFLRSQGYSEDMLHLVEINKAKTFGEKLEPQWPKNWFLRGYKKFYAYIDPAEDYGDFGLHEIHASTTPWDY